MEPARAGKHGLDDVFAQDQQAGQSADTDGVDAIATGLVNAEKRVTIRHQDLHSKQGWELHEGFEVTGWPVMTLSRGEVIVENGNVLGQAGRGRLLKRKRFADVTNIIDVR
jgi:dihydropyrimidinase